MDLYKFLSALEENQFSDSHVILFKHSNEYGAQPPLIFFQHFLARVKNTGKYLEFIDVLEQPISHIVARFETTFLGNTVFFWLRNFHALDLKKRKELLIYLAKYQGGHTIATALDDTLQIPLPGVMIVDMPAVVDHILFKKLTIWFGQRNTPVSDSLGKKLGIGKKKISLDAACLIIRYITVLGSGLEQFVKEWLDKIIVPENSLFSLSQFFFAKDVPAFLRQWQAMRHDYADVFWTIYFSEQLWRARYYVAAARSNSSDLKALSFRLPFTFIKKDWRAFSIEELSFAHNRIYEIDYDIKNGTGSFGLELFFIQFLNNEFKV